MQSDILMFPNTAKVVFSNKHSAPANKNREAKSFTQTSKRPDMQDGGHCAHNKQKNKKSIRQAMIAALHNSDLRNRNAPSAPIFSGPIPDPPNLSLMLFAPIIGYSKEIDNSEFAFREHYSSSCSVAGQKLGVLLKPSPLP